MGNVQVSVRILPANDKETPSTFQKAQPFTVQRVVSKVGDEFMSCKLQSHLGLK